MKRIVIVLLVLVMIFTGCAPAKEEEKVEEKLPTDDGMLNILMIGNSFCYYYTDELYDMLASAGIKANVCNVYYSGCTVQSHSAWLKSGEPNYEFISVSEYGRTSQKGLPLDVCLGIEEWDVISLQQHFNPDVADDLNEASQKTTAYAASVFRYLKENHPNARLLWHQTWAYQVGYEGPVNRKPEEVPMDQKVLTKEKQDLTYENIRAVSVDVAESNAVDLVPSGDAWQLARANTVVGDVLCNKNNTDSGDNYHDGDTGGGQFLNACVWYEVITGESCLENEFVPIYGLGEEKIAALKGAAHQAVAKM